MDQLLNSLVSGNSPNDWLIMKFILAGLGGLSGYMFKYYTNSTGETKIDFWWKGFWFTIISMFGGVFVIGPQTAFNAFIAGLLGWSAIANTLKQDNEGASDEMITRETLTKEQLIELLKKKGNE